MLRIGSVDTILALMTVEGSGGWNPLLTRNDSTASFNGKLVHSNQSKLVKNSLTTGSTRCNSSWTPPLNTVNKIHDILMVKIVILLGNRPQIMVDGVNMILTY